MAFVKCPRCELNYILDGGKLCSVCIREVKGEPERDDLMELCSECGERPAAHGEERCLFCLKELGVRVQVAQPEDLLVTDTSLDMDSVSTMDEIEIDLDGDIPARDFGEIEVEFEDVEEEEHEDDEEDV